MRLDFNSEEINLLFCKLSMLKSYKKIIKLGYKYDDENTSNNCLEVLLNDDYGNPTIDMVTFYRKALKKILGTGSVKEIDEYDKKIFDELELEIPINMIDDSCNGYFININNEMTKKYVEYGLDYKNLYYSMLNIVDCFEEQISVICIQLAIDKEKGFFIVVPDEYSIINEELFDAVTNFLTALYDHVKMYEMEAKK